MKRLGEPATIWFDFASLTALSVLGLACSLVDKGAVTFLIVLLALLIGIVSPVASVAAIGASVPFIYDPVPLRNGHWSLLELSIGIATASIGLRVLLEVFQSRSFGPVFRLLQPWPIVAGAMLLVAVGAISLFTVAETRFRSDSVREFRWELVEPVLVFLLLRWALPRSGARRLILGSFVGVGACVAVLGLIQLIVGHGVVIADGVERATGPYPHPNNLALYLDRVSIFLLALAIGFPRYRRWFAPIAVVGGIGLVATLSRGAVLGYLVAAVFIILVARCRITWRQYAVSGVVLVALAAIAGVSRLTDKGSSGATSSRQLIWSAGVHMLRDHSLTGVGLDQFLYQYNRRYVSPSGWPERYTSHPHNIVLDLWLSLGVAGLIAGAILLAIVTNAAWKRPVARRDEVIWIACGGALIAGLVHGLVDNGYFLPDLAVMTWMLIALLESTRSEISGSSKSTIG